LLKLPHSRSPASIMSDDESEIEDDERIMKAMTYSEKHSPEETAAYVRDELGGKDALVYENLFVGKDAHARAHWIIKGAACLNEEKPLGPQLEKHKALFKTATQGTDDQAALLVMLELFCVKESQGALKKFNEVLKVLWERDIVEQEVIEAWVENERAVAEFHPGFFDQNDAEAIRKSSRKFVQWLQEGED